MCNLFHVVGRFEFWQIDNLISNDIITKSSMEFDIITEI